MKIKNFFKKHSVAIGACVIMALICLLSWYVVGQGGGEVFTSIGQNMNVIGDFTVGGNVGIGTTSPGGKLQISTDSESYSEPSAPFTIKGVTDSNKILAMGFHTTGNVGWIQSVQYGTETKPLALQPNGGNVGIGTTSPGAKLDVNGTTYARWGGAGASGLYDRASKNTGNFLININGWGCCNWGLITDHSILALNYLVHSDERMKNNIKKIDQHEGIKFIKEVDPVHFYWKDDDKNSSFPSQGYIAQQVYAAEFPNLINIVPDERMQFSSGIFNGKQVDSPEGFSLNVNYEGVIPYLHAASREIIEYSYALESRIDVLEKIIDELCAEIEELK
jgi:hypothetical protein